MKLIAISGSARRVSSNTHSLEMMRQFAPDDLEISIFAGLGELPVFSPDNEGPGTPV